MRGNNEVVEILLDNEDIKIDTADRISWTALHWACYSNNMEGVKLFLEHPSCTKDIVGIKYSVCDDGETAEMVAEREGSNECARLVREYLEKKSLSNNVLTVPEKIKAGEVTAGDERVLEELVERISILRPSCPVCLETMEAPVRIFNCGNGHLICSTCQPRVRECYCGAWYMGRATAVEQILRDMHCRTSR